MKIKQIGKKYGVEGRDCFSNTSYTILVKSMPYRPMLQQVFVIAVLFVWSEIQDWKINLTT